MKDAHDRRFDRALEAALNDDVRGAAVAAPLGSELAELLDTARHVRRLQSLPAPVGLAERLAALLARDLEAPSRPEPTLEPPSLAPDPGFRPNGHPRLPAVIAALVSLSMFVWLLVRDRAVDAPSPAAPTIGAVASSTPLRPPPTAEALHSPEASQVAAPLPPTLRIVSPQERAATRAAPSTPTSLVPTTAPEQPVQEERTPRSTATPLPATATTPPTGTPTTAGPSHTPVVEPSRTEPPPTSPPATPTKKPTEPREATRTATVPRDVTETPVGEPTAEPTEAPTRVIDPVRTPTVRR